MEQNPQKLTADQILLKELAGKESPKSPAVLEREKATELQLYWTIAAWILMGLIVAFLMVLSWQWFKQDRYLQEHLFPAKSSPDLQGQLIPAQSSPPDWEKIFQHYKAVSDLAFERTWRIVDRVILGGLMSLLTLTIGYVFGARKAQ